jgi:hypothetical protein
VLVEHVQRGLQRGPVTRAEVLHQPHRDPRQRLARRRIVNVLHAVLHAAGAIGGSERVDSDVEGPGGTQQGIGGRVAIPREQLRGAHRCAEHRHHFVASDVREVPIEDVRDDQDGDQRR